MTMPTAELGRSGLSVSRLCLGSMQFGWTADERTAFSIMDTFVAAGGNFLDTADVYSRWHEGNPGGVSEEIIGRWLKARGNRDRILVGTKVRGAMWDGPDGEGLSRSHIIRACEDSLRRLQVETIDLYQCHSFDDRTPVEETLRTFEDLVKAGKVRHIGASNYPPELLREALEISRSHGLPSFVSLQPHHSMVHRHEYEVALAPVCAEYGLGVNTYSPLASGFLTGKYVRGGEAVKSARARAVSQYFTSQGWAVVDAIRDIAARRQTTCAAVALAWELGVDGVTSAVVGANTVAQLEEQLPCLSLELSATEVTALETASLPFLHYNQPL